jgi:hypothetical protein
MPSVAPCIGAAEEIVRPALPLAGAQEVFALGDAPCGSKHQREAEVGRGFSQHVGRVGHRDAARRAGGDVDVVVADGHRAHSLELRAGRDQRRVDRLGGGDEDAVVALQTGDEFVARPVDGRVIGRDVEVLTQLVHDRRKNLTCDQNLGLAHF